VQKPNSKELVTMLRDIVFPLTQKYSSDENHLPNEFFMLINPQYKRIDSKLGLLNSNGIRTTSCGFAQFIHDIGILNISSC
jgi:hypothetical protein